MADVSNKDNTIRNCVIVVAMFLFIVAAYLYNKVDTMGIELNISEQNQKALQDSVRISKNKAGQLEYSKNVLVATNDNLEKLNKDLFDEYKKENGKVSELTKFIAVIQKKPNDTIKIPVGSVISYPNGSKGLPWSYEKIYDKDNYRRISGVTDFKIDFTTSTYEIKPLFTKITKDEIGFNIIQGLRETKNGDVEMFVRSDYPDFSVKELNSVIINPETHPVLEKFAKTTKQKRFGIGVFGGYGIYVDNFKNTAGVGVQLGVGVSYSLLNF